MDALLCEAEINSRRVRGARRPWTRFVVPIWDSIAGMPLALRHDWTLEWCGRSRTRRLLAVWNSTSIASPPEV